MNDSLPEKRSHLYIISSDGGMVKIGRSNAPRQRIADLRTATGHRLTLVKVLRGRGHEETHVHQALRRWRRRGEWFTDTDRFREALSATLGADIQFGRWQSISEVDSANMTADVRAVCDEIRGRPANADELAAYDADDRFWNGHCTLQERNAAYARVGRPTMSRQEADLGP